MYGVLVVLHVLVAVLLVLVVLVQQPQKGGLGTLLGGGESVFGSGGAAPFMAKLTSALAIAFMLTSLGLVILSRPRRQAIGPEEGRSVRSGRSVAAVLLEENNVRGG